MVLGRVEGHREELQQAPPPSLPLLVTLSSWHQHSMQGSTLSSGTPSVLMTCTLISLQPSGDVGACGRADRQAASSWSCKSASTHSHVTTPRWRI